MRAKQFYADGDAAPEFMDSLYIAAEMGGAKNAADTRFFALYSTLIS